MRAHTRQEPGQPAMLGLEQPPSMALSALCGLDWIRRDTWPSIEGKEAGSCAVADLFCGCGGLSLGVWEALRARRYRMDVKLALDNDPEAMAVYKANFRVSEDATVTKKIEHVLSGAPGDALSGTEEALKRLVGRVDVVVAGPPCQGHSDLNNSTRRHDPRNELYLKVARFVELASPAAVIIENVPAVVHDKGRVVAATQGALEGFGYEVRSVLLDALSLGLPQRRKRHLLVAVRGREFGETALRFADAEDPAPLSEFIGDVEEECLTSKELFRTPSRMAKDNLERVAHLFEKDCHDLPDELRPACHRDKDHTYASAYGRLWWDRPAQTITSGFGSMGQGRFVHPRQPRMLTPHEAARIQGLPDFFDFSPVRHRTALNQMIGNAVPPRVAALVLDHLLGLGVLRGAAHGTA